MDSGWSLKHLHRLIVDFGHLSPVVPGDARASSQGPLQPAAGPRAPLPGRRRDRARHRAGGQRALEPRDRRPERLSAAPAFLFQPPASYGPKTWVEADRAGPLSPGPLHVPVPLGPLPDAPDVRRPQRRLFLRPPRAVEHAAAGPDHAQRAGLLSNVPERLRCGCSKDGGATDADRLCYAFRRCLARSPAADETATAPWPCSTARPQRFATGAAKPWDLAVDKPEDALPLPPDATPAQLAGWTAVARVLLNLDETITKE